MHESKQKQANPKSQVTSQIKDEQQAGESLLHREDALAQQLSGSGNIPNPGVQAQMLSRLPANPEMLLQMQQQFGNSHVSQVVQMARQQPVIQAKLKIGAPGDKYEQEADRVASEVVQRIHAPEIGQQQPEATLQPKLMVQGKADGEMTASPELASSIQGARGGGQPLADNIREPMEQAFGADFSGVRIHADEKSDQLNRSIQAKAFTTGQDIFVKRNEYQPQSREGQELIAHELTHVRQQKNEQNIQRKDVVENIVLKGRRKKDMKDTLESCINKFRTAISEARENVEDSLVGQKRLERLELVLSHKGRDAFFYRKILSKNRGGLEEDLNRWQRSWSIARTGGLLADLGLALRNVPMDIFTGGLTFDEIMNNYLQIGSAHVRKRELDEDVLSDYVPEESEYEYKEGEVPTGSEWSDDLKTSKIKGNAGPSSTTTQLLHVVSSIGTFTDIEVEVMMVALVKFWKGRMKRTFGGGYHTAAEVWAPYTGYREAQNE